jgi:DNA (cytosine-5)-methyltransferase 1
MPKLLDLFCGAGGAGAGYARAGWEVTGVDCVPQPRYPFAFRCGDALEFLRRHGREYDAVHASPPCQRHSRCRYLPGARQGWPDLLGAARRLCRRLGLPYVLENVPDAPLEGPATLCGSMFGLDVRRHRLFESSVPLAAPGPCAHQRQPDGRFPARVRRRRGSAVAQLHGSGGPVRLAVLRAACGIDWMTRAELAQAVPPAYTEWVGRQLLEALAGRRRRAA